MLVIKQFGQLSHDVIGWKTHVKFAISHFQLTRLITTSTDKRYSLDSEDDFRSGFWNVSHQQQFFLELHSPGRSHNTN